MNLICNDVLTRVRRPRCVHPDSAWETPKLSRVGDRGDKNGMPYTVRAFGASTHRIIGVPPLSKDHPRSVWLVVKFRGDKSHKWDCLWIGDTNSFAEKLVFGGRHPNPVFTHYLPKGAPQPI